MITITKEIKLTPEELAREFLEFDAGEQGEFLNICSREFKELGGNGVMQLDWFIDELDDDGRDFVERMKFSLDGWHEVND